MGVQLLQEACFMNLAPSWCDRSVHFSSSSGLSAASHPARSYGFTLIRYSFLSAEVSSVEAGSRKPSLWLYIRSSTTSSNTQLRGTNSGLDLLAREALSGAVVGGASAK